MTIEELLDRYEQPTHRGRLPCPPARSASGTNPRCGDLVTMFVELREGTLEHVTFEGGGCTLSQSGADMLAELVEGLPVSTARELTLKTLLQRLGERNVGSRLECVAVGLRALQQALHDQ